MCNFHQGKNIENGIMSAGAVTTPSIGMKSTVVYIYFVWDLLKSPVPPLERILLIL